MLFIICLALLVGGIICGCVWNYEEWTIVLIAIGAFATLICLAAICIGRIDVDGDIARMNVKRESLVYQYENDIYENDNDYGRRELMVDIQKYNSYLATMKERQDDFWIGIFIPNIYDQFELIELE